MFPLKFQDSLTWKFYDPNADIAQIKIGDRCQPVFGEDTIRFSSELGEKNRHTVRPNRRDVGHAL